MFCDSNIIWYTLLQCITIDFLCDAADGNGTSSSSTTQSVASGLRILPAINDISGPTALALEESHNSFSDSGVSALCSCGGCGVGFRPSCHKQALDSNTDCAPDKKLLPSACDASSASVGDVTVADIHADDSSPRQKLLPSLHSTSRAEDRNDGRADICANDTQPQVKLLPSPFDANTAAEVGDNHIGTVNCATDSQLQEKLLPSLSATV